MDLFSRIEDQIADDPELAKDMLMDLLTNYMSSDERTEAVEFLAEEFGIPTSDW